MTESMTVSVPVRWIIGEPCLLPVGVSQQGYNDLCEPAEGAEILRYRGDFEIMRQPTPDDQRGDYRYTVLWNRTDYTTFDLDDAEWWLAQQIVNDGAISQLCPE